MGKELVADTTISQGEFLSSGCRQEITTDNSASNTASVQEAKENVISFTIKITLAESGFETKLQTVITLQIKMYVYKPV